MIHFDFELCGHFVYFFYFEKLQILVNLGWRVPSPSLITFSYTTIKHDRPSEPHSSWYNAPPNQVLTWIWPYRGWGRGRQWRSQGLPGWATRPPGSPKWGRRSWKNWGKMKKNTGKWGKIEETFLSCPPGSERLATALEGGGDVDTQLRKWWWWSDSNLKVRVFQWGFLKNRGLFSEQTKKKKRKKGQTP